MTIDSYKSQKKILEFNFIFQNEEDKIIMIDMLSSLMIVKYQINIKENYIQDLKLNQYYSFKYDWDNKDKFNFIQLPN